MHTSYAQAAEPVGQNGLKSLILKRDSGGGGNRTRVLASALGGFYKLSRTFLSRSGVLAAAASLGANPVEFHLIVPGIRLRLSMIDNAGTPYHAWGGRIRFMCVSLLGG